MWTPSRPVHDLHILLCQESSRVTFWWGVALSWTYTSFVQKRPSPRKANYHGVAWCSVGGWGFHLAPPVHSFQNQRWQPMQNWGATVTANGLEAHIWQSLPLPVVHTSMTITVKHREVKLLTEDTAPPVPEVPPQMWAFHSGAKSPLVFPERHISGEHYRGILRNALVPCARQHFGYNFCYPDDYATPHRAHARVVLVFLQQGNVTKMGQPAISPDCNPIELIWDEWGRAIISMDNSCQNFGQPCQALLDKCAETPVESLQRLVATTQWACKKTHSNREHHTKI